MTNILILSATASAINYINALKDIASIRLFVTDASKFASGLYSSRVSGFVIPRSRNQKEYKVALDKIIDENNIEILIPTSDHDMEGVLELLNNGWQPKVKMFKPNYKTYRLFSSKDMLMVEGMKEGLTVPKTYLTKKEVEFPVVIKPTREGGSKGVWIVDSKSEFESKYELVKSIYGSDIVMQEFIPGTTGSIFVVLLIYDQNGEVCAEVVSKSTLTYMTWGGGGNAGKIVENNTLIEQAKNIIKTLGGWKGPINIEFKQHSKNGKYYLMEINCRLNGYSYLYTMNGLNFPKKVIDVLLNNKTENLNHSKISTSKNFVLGFRELPIENWIG